MCIPRYEFDQAITKDTLFGSAYVFRSLCESQLIWNIEDTNTSLSILEAGASAGAYADLSIREQLYYNATFYVRISMLAVFQLKHCSLFS